MLKYIKQFTADEDGAVTVDWVVLTAAIVGLAAVAASEIKGGSDLLTAETTNYLERQDPSTKGNIQDFIGGGAPATGNNVTPPED